MKAGTGAVRANGEHPDQKGGWPCRMPGTALLFLFLCLSCTSTGAGPEAPVPSGSPGSGGAGLTKEVNGAPAARVNGKEISREALAGMMNSISSQLDRPAGSEEIRATALEALILQELAHQKAVAEGLHADSGEVEDIVAGLKRKLKSEEAYQQFLDEEGLTETEFRLRAARNLTIERILTREVIGKAVVPEAHLKAEYARVKEKHRVPEKVLVIDIEFARKNGDNGLRKKAEALLFRIRKDPDRDLEKLPLDGSFLVRRRDVDRERDRKLYAAAVKLKPGALSPVIGTPEGYHILKLLEHRRERPMRFDELKPVLVRNLIGLYREKRLREWGEEMKANAVIEILAP